MVRRQGTGLGKEDEDPVLAGDSPGGRAAVAAWREVDDQRRAPSRVWFIGNRNKKRGIYRLDDARGPGLAVIAKRCHGPSADLEPRIHGRVLPLVGVSTPRLFGVIDTGDGASWLLLEDVGSERFSRLDPAHRVLAAAWLGRLHARAPDVVGPADLPDRGPGHHLGRLREARGVIEANRENPVLEEADQRLLDAIVTLLDMAEARWPAIEALARRLPSTLVHGDFQPKNVFVRMGSAGPMLFPIDWEEAGWGVPAPDIVPAHGRAGQPHVDAAAYGRRVRDRWPDLDDRTIRELALLGTVLRRISAIAWSAGGLGHRWPERSIAQLEIYRPELEEALAIGPW